MKELYKFIFDMDGTLYSFDKGKGDTFVASQFHRDLQKNIYGFFMNRLNISEQQATSEYDRLKEIYHDQVSLGVEAEYGISRFEYFEQTWNFDASVYLEKDTDLEEMFGQLQGKIALLTLAPRIWAMNVLQFLNIAHCFENVLYTGEPDMRKPDPVVFEHIIADFNIPASHIFSIGDQEETDIIPAKSIGLKTIMIGDKQTSADYQVKDVKKAIQLLRMEGFL